MRKLSLFAFFLVVIVNRTARARVEFIIQHDNQRLRGAEICFFKVASAGVTPNLFWFPSNDLRCLPADQLIDIPVGRFRFFGHAPGLITRDENLIITTEDQTPESYRAKVMNAVPSATIDLSSVPLRPGESFAVLAAPDHDIAGGLFPAAIGAPALQVPAGIALLPIIIANHLPVMIGELLTIEAGKTGRAAFASKANSGQVVTWIEFDQALANDKRVSGSRYAELSTYLLSSSGKTIEPIFRLANPENAQGELQIFRDVQPGAFAVFLEGEKWEISDTQSVAVSGAVTTTEEPVRAVPAAIIHLDYKLNSAAVPITAARQQDCTATVPSAPLAFHVYRCATVPQNIDVLDVSKCRVIQSKTAELAEGVDVKFPRLPMGEYVIEASYPTLGRTRARVTALPNDELNVVLSPAVFPVFGRATRGKQPVRAAVTFGEGIRSGTAVSNADGRYEIILPADPKDNFVYLKACDGSFEYTDYPSTALLPNAAFDVSVPSSSLQVVSRDSANRQPIPKALVFCAVTSSNPSIGEYRLRSVSNSDGVAQFTAVPSNEELKVCASAQSQGYASQICAEKFRLADDEQKTVEVLLPRTGKVKGRLITTAPSDPAMFAFVAANGVMRQRVFVDEAGTFWLRDIPSPGDYFVLTAPGGTLYVITVWTSDDDGSINVAAPTGVRIRTFSVRAPNTSEKGRIVGLAIGGRHVPSAVVSFHLLNYRINMLSPWPILVPNVAESGPIAVTLGPGIADYPPELPQGSDLFVLPQFMVSFRTLTLAPNRDDLEFK